MHIGALFIYLSKIWSPALDEPRPSGEELAEGRTNFGNK